MNAIPDIDIHVGQIGNMVDDWRETINDAADIDLDDELGDTPVDVLLALGFDPADESDQTENVATERLQADADGVTRYCGDGLDYRLPALPTGGHGERGPGPPGHDPE